MPGVIVGLLPTVDAALDAHVGEADRLALGGVVLLRDRELDAVEPDVFIGLVGPQAAEAHGKQVRGILVGGDQDVFAVHGGAGEIRDHGRGQAGSADGDGAVHEFPHFLIGTIVGIVLDGADVDGDVGALHAGRGHGIAVGFIARLRGFRDLCEIELVQTDGGHGYHSLLKISSRRPSKVRRMVSSASCLPSRRAGFHQGAGICPPMEPLCPCSRMFPTMALVAL